MENKALRDSNSKLSVSLSQYKFAYRNLRERLQATNDTVRNLQNVAPNINKEIQTLLDRFKMMGAALASVNVEDIENQALFNNLNVNDNSQKLKPRKRRGKLPTMKFNVIITCNILRSHKQSSSHEVWSGARQSCRVSSSSAPTEYSGRN